MIIRTTLSVSVSSASPARLATAPPRRASPSPSSPLARLHRLPHLATTRRPDALAPRLLLDDARRTNRGLDRGEGLATSSRRLARGGDPARRLRRRMASPSRRQSHASPPAPRLLPGERREGWRGARANATLARRCPGGRGASSRRGRRRRPPPPVAAAEKCRGRTRGVQPRRPIASRRVTTRTSSARGAQPPRATRGSTEVRWARASRRGRRATAAARAR